MDKQEYKRAMIALFEEGRYKFDDTHIEKLMALDEVALARKLADDADWFDQTKVVYEPKKTDFTKLAPSQKDMLLMLPLGSERTLPRADLEMAFKTEKRNIELRIERLKNRAIPIVALKDDDHGYFIPRTQEELELGLRAYEAQIKTSLKMITVLRNIDLEEFHEKFAEEKKKWV